MKKEKSELEIEFEQTIDFLKKRMSEYEFEYDKKLRDIKFLEEENKNLKEKVETLELWLDNKEKLNEEYRKEIDLLKCQTLWPSELADSLYDADKTIEKLKEEIKEIEKNQEYRYHRCMKAERQVQHSLGWDDELIYEEWLYD